MDTFVLDTSSLVNNPKVYEQFHNSIVIIPIIVLSELDKLKKQTNEVGKNARVCIKLLDKISEMGDIDTGILLDNNILLKVDTRFVNLTNDYIKFGPLDYGDTQILVNAYEVQKELKSDSSVVLITNDINLRVKARAFGLQSQKCDETKAVSELSTTCVEITDNELGHQLATLGWVDVGDVPEMDMNQFVLFKNFEGSGISLGRKISDELITLINNSKPWGLKSKNKEQALALDLLLDDNVKLVCMTGLAGCGKTILTLASALELIVEKKKYTRCIVYRPVEPVGKDIGYLPGSMDEKIAPYFQNINDNLEALSTKRKSTSDTEMLKKIGKIEYQPLTYIRGRSISNALIVCDEAQNLSKEDVKTLLTRVSQGTKVILNGDIDQIDNKSLDAVDNGLTYVINKFRSSSLFGHVHFTQGERSELAKQAAERL